MVLEIRIIYYTPVINFKKTQGQAYLRQKYVEIGFASFYLVKWFCSQIYDGFFILSKFVQYETEVNSR